MILTGGKTRVARCGRTRGRGHLSCADLQYGGWHDAAGAGGV